MKGLCLILLLSSLCFQRIHSIIFNCSNSLVDLMIDSSLDSEFTTTFINNYFTTAPNFNVRFRVMKSPSFNGSRVKDIYFSATILDSNGNLTSMNFGTFPVIDPLQISNEYPCYEGSWPDNISGYWRAEQNVVSYPDTVRICVGISISESPSSGYVYCKDIRMAQAVTKPIIEPGIGNWNNNIDLTCSVSVFPQPTFKWYYNGVEISASAHYRLVDVSSTHGTGDDYRHILGVLNARTYDTLFSYTCSVTNILQTQEISSDVSTLSIIDLPIKLLNSPEDTVNGFLEKSVVVNCTFASYPSPSIIWKKNGTRIYNNSRICIIPGMEREDPDDGIVVYSRLAFSSLEYSDAGTYTCEAMRGGNMPLTMTRTFTLDIINAPNITFISSDSAAVLNTYVSLLCQADGVPPPDITWYNSDGMMVSTTPSVSVRVMNTGANTWTCEASNVGGAETSSVTVIGYREAANITSLPRDTTIEYRERASFVCMVIGDPIPLVTWYFTHYNGGSEEELTVNNSIYTISNSMLLIQKATLGEQGTYRCEAINIARSVTASASLTILQVRPSVQIRPISTNVTYNTLLSITCVSAGMPSPLLTVIRPDGVKFNAPYNIMLFNENDIGSYSCVATSPLNGEVAVQSATYSLPSLNVTVSPATAAVNKTSTEDLIFTCTVIGTPTFSTMKWYHQNQCSGEMTEILNADLGYVLSGTTLTITPDKVLRFLPGLYICRVERFSYNFSGNASLTLTSGDSVNVSPLVGDYDCPDLSSGQTRQFVCSATTSSSNPITYSWFRNREELNAVSDPTTITINNFGYGNYRCVATVEQVCNYMDSAVEGGLSVSISPITISIVVEQSFSIYCNADGFPTLTYTWYKNGVVIANQNLPSYTIVAATTADIGTYSCTVYLPACLTNMTSTGSTVNIMQVAPTISTLQQDYNVVVGTDKTLMCNSMGAPTPNYQWYKNLVMIPNEISSMYTISSANAVDAGLYTCEAFSFIARSFKDISNIVVYQTPNNIQITGVPVGPVNQGQQIILICTAIGIPEVEYEWSDSNSNIVGNMGALTVVIQGDSGYTCKARNDWGFVTESATIIVKVDVVIPQSSDITTIVIPATMGGLAVIIVCVMVCLIGVMFVLNSRRIKRNRRGVIAAENSNVLLSDQLIRINSADLPDVVTPSRSSLSSEGSEDSINVDVMQKKAVELSGGLDRSKPLTGAKLMELISKVEGTGGSEGDNELCQEFESIPSNMAKWTTMPKDSEIKNRYMNVLPNENTMVELSSTGEAGSTFINANYIADYRLFKKNTYIATQGPLPSTIADFWRMVWENDVSAVVMTCNLVERKRIRCSRYWPDTNQRPTEIYGTYKVSIDSFAKADDYDISILYLSDLKAGANEIQKKQVYHYWYKAWPSFGVPQETSKIWNFLKEVHSNVGDNGKPVLFHCSAGIGRTAVFIGIDMGLHEYKSNTKVDPLKYLCTLRKGRGGSVQTTEQYLYMHRVLHDFIMAQTNK